MGLLPLSDEVFCRNLKGSSAQLYSFVSLAGGETMGKVFPEFLQGSLVTLGEFNMPVVALIFSVAAN